MMSAHKYFSRQKKNMDIGRRMCYNTMNHNMDTYAMMHIFREFSQLEVFSWRKNSSLPVENGFGES